MKTVTVTLYEFDELSDAAKEKARDWWRQCESQDFDTSSLYDDFQSIAECLGIKFKQHPVTLMGGGTRYHPAIWWTLHVQGAGASFEGSYEYVKGSVAKIRQYAPQDKELHRIANELSNLQKAYVYGLTATIHVNGHGTHKYNMAIDAFDRDGRELPYITEQEDDIQHLTELMRDFADWMYRSIDEEYTYRMSDENVDESIRINEYTFRENGKRSDG